MNKKDNYLILIIFLIITLILIYPYFKQTPLVFGIIFVLGLRLFLPLTVPKWPLFGVIACLIADAIDVILVDLFNSPGFGSYHQVDKILDMYYLTIAFVYSLNWKGISKNTSIFLFLYRVIGVVGFELTGTRLWLFIFQNLFENFFIFELIRQKYFSYWKLTLKRLLIVLLILEIPKMPTEYILHYRQAAPWTFIKQNILNIK